MAGTFDQTRGSSVRADPADEWRRTLSSLRAFGCVPNDQNAVGDGRVAMNFLSLVAVGTPELPEVERSIRDARASGNDARLVYARWVGVFALVEAVFGLELQEDERARVLSGQSDTIVHLLQRLLLQARASPRWEAAVVEAHERQAHGKVDGDGWAVESQQPAGRADSTKNAASMKSKKTPKEQSPVVSQKQRKQQDLSSPRPQRRTTMATEPGASLAFMKPRAVDTQRRESTLAARSARERSTSPPSPPKPQPQQTEADATTTTARRRLEMQRSLEDVAGPTFASMARSTRTNAKDDDAAAPPLQPPKRRSVAPTSPTLGDDDADVDEKNAAASRRDPSLIAIAEVKRQQRLRRDQQRRSDVTGLSIAEQRRREAETRAGLQAAASTPPPPRSSAAKDTAPPMSTTTPPPGTNASAGHRGQPPQRKQDSSAASPTRRELAPLKGAPKRAGGAVAPVVHYPRRLVAPVAAPVDIESAQEARRAKARALLAEMQRVNKGTAATPTIVASASVEDAPSWSPSASLATNGSPPSPPAAKATANEAGRSPFSAGAPPGSTASVRSALKSPVSSSSGLPSPKRSVKVVEPSQNAEPTPAAAASNEPPAENMPTPATVGSSVRLVPASASPTRNAAQSPPRRPAKKPDPLVQSLAAAPDPAAEATTASSPPTARRHSSPTTGRPNKGAAPAPAKAGWRQQFRGSTSDTAAVTATEDEAQRKSAPGPHLSVFTSITITQQFMRGATAAILAARNRQRAPAGRLLRCWARYRLRVKAARAFEAARVAEQGPDPVAAWTPCGRCVPVLTALRTYVERRHAVKVKVLQRSRKALCGRKECAAALARVVRDTQDCNIHRNDPSSLSLVDAVHRSLRWRISTEALRRAEAHAAVVAAITRVQAAVRWHHALIAADGAIASRHWLLESRFLADDAALDRLRQLQRAGMSVCRLRKLSRTKRLQRQQAAADHGRAGRLVCAERCTPVYEMLQRRWVAAPSTVNLHALHRYTQPCCGQSAHLSSSSNGRCAVTLLHRYLRLQTRRYVGLFASVSRLVSRCARLRLVAGRPSWERKTVFVHRLVDAALAAAAGDGCADKHGGIRCNLFVDALVRRVAHLSPPQLLAPDDSGVAWAIARTAASFERRLCRTCWDGFVRSGCAAVVGRIRAQRIYRQIGITALALRAAARFLSVVPNRTYGVQTVQRFDHGDGVLEVHAAVRSASLRHEMGDRRLQALLRNAACPRDRPLLEALRDAVVSDDTLGRIRPGPDAAEWRSLNPRLGLYAGMCGTCASLVPMHHKYCLRWIQCLRFIQCRCRWTRLRRRVVRPAAAAASSTNDAAMGRFEAVCRRCPPIETQLVTRTLAHATSLPPERVRAYAAVMCDGCGAAALARLRRVERQSDAAVKIQRAFRGVVALRRGRHERRELAMERAADEASPPPPTSASPSAAFADAAKNPAVAGTRGRCAKCEPVLDSLTQRIEGLERKNGKMPEAVADRFTASCCARCRAIAESRIRQHLAGARLVDAVPSDDEDGDDDPAANAAAEPQVADEGAGALSPQPEAPQPAPTSVPPAAVAPAESSDSVAPTPRKRAVVVVDSPTTAMAVPPAADPAEARATEDPAAGTTEPQDDPSHQQTIDAPAPAKSALSPSPSLSIAGVAKQEIMNARMERARERAAQRFRSRSSKPKTHN